MIINQPGEKFEHEGNVYKIGDSVFATNESGYKGLYGSITEIRDGDDKETENDTPDFYCCFDEPVLPCEIEELEATFSTLYQMPKKLEDISLDLVIMAPEMVQVLDDSFEDRRRETLYAVVEDWAANGEEGHNEQLFTEKADAVHTMHRLLRKEKDDGCIPCWEHKEDFTVEAGEESYECYLEGYYCESHYSISVEKKELFGSESFIRRQGELWLAQNRRNDFVSQIDQWDKADELTEEQCELFINDPSIPERISTKLSKNDSYWESYWSCVQNVADDLLSKYVPGKDNPFRFEYQLLSRLQADCEYFIGNGNRAIKHLWAGGVEKQIAKMRELYELLPEKPEWLSTEEIDRYEFLMTHETKKEAIDGVECHVWSEEPDGGRIATAYCFRCAGWDRITVFERQTAVRIIGERTKKAITEAGEKKEDE